jgi:protein involved in polysaccharide export with SLBB domain
MRHFLPLSAAILASLLLASCGTMKKAVSWIPVPPLPSIPLPSFSSIKRVIPGMDRYDKVDGKDPNIAFSPEATLTPGHTLRLKVFSGTRDANEEFEGLVMIDENGVADFDEYGKARLAGLSAREARRAVERLFRSGGFTAATLNVQIVSIENVKLVFVEGDVARPRVLAHDRDLQITQCILAAGGRAARSSARTLYVTQQGLRKFYRSEAVANEEVELEPGDVIYLNPEF